MSIIAQEQRRLDNIYTMYTKTSGEMKKMWGKKWYELDESKRLTTDLGKIH